MRNLYRSRVNLIVNGDPQSCTEGLTIAALISDLGLNQRRVAVEVNRAIIPRGQYDTHALADGDQIEIVHFVGGG